MIAAPLSALPMAPMAWRRSVASELSKGVRSRFVLNTQSYTSNDQQGDNYVGGHRASKKRPNNPPKAALPTQRYKRQGNQPTP